MKDYYVILGLPKKADKSRIKKAYREKIKSLHPDKTGASEDRQSFLDATEAYETLTDDAKRRAYDRKLNKKRSGTQIPVSRSSGFSGTGRHPGSRPVYGRFKNFRKTPSPIIERRLDLILSPEEAASGGRFSFSVPVFQACPYCRHAGLLDQLFCPACGGKGVIPAEKRIILDLPAGIAHGTVFEELVQTGEEPRILLHITVLID